MIVEAVHVRRFRSVRSAVLENCGGLNVLIGKNNAGKSNLLTSIELMMNHLRLGSLAAPWPNPRPAEDFTDRETGELIKIGVQFELSPEWNKSLRAASNVEAPNPGRSIEQIGEQSSLSFILSGCLAEKLAFFFLEAISAGRLSTAGDQLTTTGVKLLTVPKQAALELFSIYQTVSALRSDLDSLESLRRERDRISYYFQDKSRSGLEVLFYAGNQPIRFALRSQIEPLATSAKDADEFIKSLGVLAQSMRARIAEQGAKATDAPMIAFAGEARTVPDYAKWLIQQYGSLQVLPLRETREPIGRAEASTLLQFKVRRGGTVPLREIQETVKSLLGVNVDAYEADTRGGERRAEIDIDNFLLEANGAGVREALRLVLDLELKDARIALIEEPEVHLHPGLARVVAAYLRQKSRDLQMFVATQSTEFVDTVTFQNAYLVSGDADNKTTCQRIDAEESALRIPTELGLRLSSVFMFDRLVFVEGPVDEAVLREFARLLNLDVTKTNVGFVHMGGVRNFVHFAAEGTLDLLSRRQIRMWFVTDRDEKDDLEVQKMVGRLGSRANLFVLNKRELENYLLIPRVLAEFIREKFSLSRSKAVPPSETDIQTSLGDEVIRLKPDIIRLRLEKRLLAPIFLQLRNVGGGINEQLTYAISEATRRRQRLSDDAQALTKEIDAAQTDELLRLVPGSLMLEAICNRYEVRFSKEHGDSERLAQSMRASEVASEIRDLLQSICSELPN